MRRMRRARIFVRITRTSLTREINMSTTNTTPSTRAESFTRDVAGGWGHEGIAFTLGVNSGSGGIGFGVSDQRHAVMTGATQTTSLHLSMTPDDAEAVGRALIAHAEAVRARIAERGES